MAAISIQYTILLYELFFVENALALLVGTFLLTHESNNYSIGVLHLIIDLNKTKVKRAQIFMELSRFIRLHSANKRFEVETNISNGLFNLFPFFHFRLVFGLSDLFQPNTLVTMICVIILICISMLMMQIELVSWFCFVLFFFCTLNSFPIFFLYFFSLVMKVIRC